MAQHPSAAHDLLDVVGTIYDTAIDTRKWDTVLAKLAQVFAGNFAQVVHADRDSLKVNFVAVHAAEALSRSCTPTATGAAAVDDVRSGALATHRRNGLRRQEICRQLMHPMRPDQRLCVCFTDDAHRTFTGLGVMRAQTAQPFSRDESAALETMIPHMKRALAIRSRMATVAEERDSLSRAVDRLPLGIVLVSRPGRIVFANAAARDMAGDGLLLQGERVTAALQSDRIRLRAALAAAAEGCLSAAEVLTVTRTSGHRPLTLLVSPVAGHVGDGASTADRPVAAVYISDPERDCAGAVHVLRSLFALTSAEAEVVEMLVCGLDPMAIADRRGASASTVRQHLKSVFRKTATARQADLVKLVTTSTAWLRH